MKWFFSVLFRGSLVAAVLSLSTLPLQADAAPKRAARKATRSKTTTAPIPAAPAPAASASPQPSPSPRLAPAVALPALSLDPQSVTVSGISSGAFMAVQLQVARSSMIHGAATVAGGPFYCAKGSADTAQRDCMGNPDAIKVPELIASTREFAAKNQIDSLETLHSRGNILIIQGTLDTVVKPVTAAKLESYFAEFLPEEKIQVKADLPSGHGFPTLDFGISCENQGKPWLNRCNWDGAGAILASLIPTESGLAPRAESQTKNLQTFDQAEFGKEAFLHPTGWVYIPEGCRSSEPGRPTCRLHITLHGCAQSPQFTQDTFPAHAGYNEWAESNRIVILYPSASAGNGNPLGCWDWWGYTGSNYATRDGAQIKAIAAMVQRLTTAAQK